MKLLGTLGGEHQAHREFTLRGLVEGPNHLTQVVHTGTRGLRPCGIMQGCGIASAHDAVEQAHLEKGDELLLLLDLERADEADFGLQLVQSTLSQSSVISPENWQGREISGVVMRENIWTKRFPTLK